jgi:predicted transcriptional regulator
MPKKTVRVSVTLKRDVYENIKDTSHIQGIKPSQFISLAVTSSINNVRLPSVEDGAASPRTGVPTLLPEKMIALLRFVREEEELGKKPSHKDICRGLNITRNTARMRIRHLADTGFLVETKDGREKLVKLTQKGTKLL